MLRRRRPRRRSERAARARARGRARRDALLHASRRGGQTAARRHARDGVGHVWRRRDTRGARARRGQHLAVRDRAGLRGRRGERLSRRYGDRRGDPRGDGRHAVRRRRRARRDALPRWRRRRARLSRERVGHVHAHAGHHLGGPQPARSRVRGERGAARRERVTRVDRPGLAVVVGAPRRTGRR